MKKILIQGFIFFGSKMISWNFSQIYNLKVLLIMSIFRTKIYILSNISKFVIEFLMYDALITIFSLTACLLRKLFQSTEEQMEGSAGHDFS